MQERVQKFLSQWGVASRRQAEQMILAGRVRLNGTVVQLGQKVDPDRDQIEVDGIPVQPATRPDSIVLLLNKPLGYLSACRDPRNHRTVLDLLPPDLRAGQGIHPVGRLDVNSTGALLLTNHGDLTFYLTHPRHHIPKTYQVLVKGRPPEEVLEHWRQGVLLAGQKTLPAEVRILKQPSESTTLLQVVLREGRNRQIRRVAEQLGHPVLQLHRTAIGPIQLAPPEAEALPMGRYRPLEDEEIRLLNAQIALPSIKDACEEEDRS